MVQQFIVRMTLFNNGNLLVNDVFRHFIGILHLLFLSINSVRSIVKPSAKKQQQQQQHNNNNKTDNTVLVLTEVQRCQQVSLTSTKLNELPLPFALVCLQPWTCIDISSCYRLQLYKFVATTKDIILPPS